MSTPHIDPWYVSSQGVDPDLCLEALLAIKALILPMGRPDIQIGTFDDSATTKSFMLPSFSDRGRTVPQVSKLS